MTIHLKAAANAQWKEKKTVTSIEKIGFLKG